MKMLTVTPCRVLCVLSLCFGLVISGPVDANATQETKNLFDRLKNVGLDPDQIIFGQQRATETGIYGWKEPYKKQALGGWGYTYQMSKKNHADELCDVKSVTGDYPGLIGFNPGDYDDAKKLQVIYTLTKFAYARGSVIAYHMPISNPVTGGSQDIKEDSGDVLHSIRKILPGGANHTQFRATLDRIADFIHTLKDDNGKLIPVLFRPFHENNAKWFWWGQNNAAENTLEEYINLYQYTVKYLRDTKEIRNFLYVYAPSGKYEDFNTDGKAATAYMKTYPGNDYVDVMAFDGYSLVATDASIPTYVHHVKELVTEAGIRGKIPAIAEIGFSDSGIDSYHNFWMERILTPLKAINRTKKLAYIMTWTNRCSNSCTIWVPYKGHASEADFKAFHNDSMTVFSGNMPNLYT